MDQRLIAADGQARGPSVPGVDVLLRAFSMVRYRFFLYAGLLPYLLGAAWALQLDHHVDAETFWTGLLGIALAVVGVEAFNEFFDSRMGTDRVFDARDLPPMSVLVFWLGVAGFAGAAAIGVYLAFQAGWPVLVFAAVGGLAAAFYVGPPIRWAYRGLGELMIGLSYGPWMTLGSLYLLAHRLSRDAVLASFVPGLLIMSLAVANNIPDFHQDRLVGKRNLVVRLGRRFGVFLYLALASAALVVLAVGAGEGVFPPASFAGLLAAPLLVSSAGVAIRAYETPRPFVRAIQSVVLAYLIAVTLFTLAIVLTEWIG